MDMGETLRIAREQRGLSLDELSRKTKISTLALRAIEENDIQRLPGGIFLRGFLRAYAREVDLNAEDTVNRYVAQFEPRSTVMEEGGVDSSILEGALADPEPRPGNEPAPRPMSTLGLVAAIVFMLGLLAYVTLNQPQPAFEATVPSAASDPVVLASSGKEPSTAGSNPAIAGDDASTTGGGPASTSREIAVTSSAAATTAGETPAAITGSTSEITGNEAATTGVQEPGAVTASAGSGLALTIQTSGPCWVSAIVDGRTVIYRLMQADESETIESGNQVELRVGDPATFSFQINGAAGKSLGAAGKAATVHITGDNYQEFVVPAPTP